MQFTDVVFGGHQDAAVTVYTRIHGTKTNRNH